jgi:acyl-CoA reductase-like NAD-dependent aldehyde dehydrogenase
MASTATSHGSPQFPAVAGTMAPSSREAMDAAVQALQARKAAWVGVPVRERIALVDRLIRDFAALDERWVNACLQGKGLTPSNPAAGEEWLGGPYAVLWNMRQLRRSLAEIQARGRPRIPGPVTTRPDGQVVARVFPRNTYDRLFYTGVTAEVWMQPGVTRADLPATQAVAYHDKTHSGKVALVLGAGNVSSIGPLDTLYKLFVEDQVVLYKSNPVNAYLGPLIEEAFRALVEPGFLRLVYGGAAEGSYLTGHPGVDEVHITGSDKTFEAIVFGPGPEGAARKAAHQPLLTKRVTGELGNVSPVIVVPGPWSASDLDYQVTHIFTMLTNNAGFNCNATRVILQHASWAQRPELLRQLRALMERVPPRPAYYPGAQERQHAFVAAHPEAEQIGAAAAGQLPWTLIEGVDPRQEDDIVFTTEAFCSLFAETPLAAASVPEYIDRAVDFCNRRLWGTLNATILVHPSSLRDRAVAAAVDRAVANLQYGAVGVNYWGGAAFIIPEATWGGFPGHDIYDIQSGNDVVHNALMFSRAQKTVIRGAFRATPTPPWFVTRQRGSQRVFRRLTALEASPSARKALGIVLAALRG